MKYHLFFLAVFFLLLVLLVEAEAKSCLNDGVSPNHI